MEVKRIEDYKGGWFIGNFKPSVLKTKAFEVCYKVHPKGEAWPVHFHKKATEINYLVKGRMTIKGVLLKTGDIFTIDRREIADPKFLTDCEVVVIKVPSVKNDKYEIL